MTEEIFTEYNNNKSIYGHMAYVLDGNYKHNIILGTE